MKKAVLIFVGLMLISGILESEALAQKCGVRGKPNCPPPPRTRRRPPSVDLKERNLKELFPIFDVTYGTTTASELANLGEKELGESSYYIIKGIGFYYNDRNIVDRVYLDSIDEMPRKWKEIGFDWNLSYTQWQNLLNRLGYTVRVIKQPSIEEKQGQDSFVATLRAAKTRNAPFRITLSFVGIGKTSPDDEKTLFSILISPI